MCETCGCGDPNLVSVEVHDKILSVNDRTAAHNREHFVEGGVFAVNLMGSPGAGKTAVLEATARALAGEGPHRGDRRRPRDGARRRPPARGGGARRRHHDGLGLPPRRGDGPQVAPPFPWRELDYLFVENVGNLVCPAIYDLGQAVNVVALSVTEGEDKPLKYPVMFRKADLVLLTKVDLLPHLDFRVEAVLDALARVMPRPDVIQVAARKGDGVPEWIAWLEGRRTAQATSASASSLAHHHHS